LVLNIVFTLIFGFLVTIHISMNARVGTLAGSAVLSNAVFWLVGCATSLSIAFVRLSADSLAPLARVPPALFLAGVIGGGLALFNTWMIPRIGIAAFSLLIILGQLSASAILSRTGFLGAMVEPMPFSRLAGLALVAVGTGLFLFTK
jgi:transporter family-2 protein